MAYCTVCGCRIPSGSGVHCERCLVDVKSPREHQPEERLVDLLREGRKIEAIKRYRATRNTDLKTAKQAVEALARQHGIVLKGGKLGCVALVGLIVMGIGGYVAMRLLSP